MKIYSYVVDHDDGKEPNPYFGTCTLCRCKFSESLERTRGIKGKKNIVELAKEGDWVIGTGGECERSTGNGTLIYAMKIDEILPRELFCSRYPEKKSEPPKDDFEKQQQFALISRHFWYFGSNAKPIPDKFMSEEPNGFKLEKKGQGFRRITPEHFDLFHQWLKKFKSGRRGEPCGDGAGWQKGCKSCKSSC